MLSDNLFLKIINKEIPTDLLYDDEHCIAFRDIHPQAPTHVLIIPRKVISTHADLLESDAEVLGKMHMIAMKLAKQLGLEDGYRLVINCRDRGGQTVPHLHMHLLGGRDMNWPPG